MSKSQIVALPNSRIPLTIASDDATDTEMMRFVEAWLVVWNRILLVDRQSIEAYWQDTKPQMALGDSLGGENALATTLDAGRKIQFCWHKCRLLPLDELQVLIAHEMAHVYQCSVGKCRYNMTRNDLLGTLQLPVSIFPLQENAIVEIHADEMVERWGFDHVLHRAYLFQHFDYKNGKYVPRRKPRNYHRAYKLAKGAIERGRIDFVAFRAAAAKEMPVSAPVDVTEVS